MNRVLCLVVAAALAACAQPRSPGPAAQPDVPPRLGSADAGPLAPAASWRAFVRDESLARLAEQALAHNRDLRVAALNVERAQAALALSEAARWPVIGAGGGVARAPDTSGKQRNTFTAGVQMPAWEIDLFGRLRALDDAARAQLLATEAAQRALRTALVAQVLSTAIALRADDALVAVAERTVAARDESLRLVRLREQAGASSLLDVDSQAALAAQARVALAQAQRARAQDANALALLVGRPVSAAEVAAPADAALAPALLAEVPAGLESSLLLSRPDVVQAEALLAAASADLAAARAALWPSITLTAQAGQVSAQLSGLFESGNFAYSLAANLFFTVFDGGRRRAAIAGADAGERIALAQYERAVQAAFRETADALAGVTTWRDQLAAQAQVLAAAREVASLTDLRARQGAASLLEQLEAQRSLFAAEQALVQTQAAELAARIALFRAIGRDW
jgi:multidrug efflux system outer membrane protein